MEKRGLCQVNVDTRGSAKNHTYVALILLGFLFLASTLSTYDGFTGVTGGLVLGENASYGYFGPTTLNFSSSLTMDLDYYFNASGLTYLGTDPEGADVDITDSTLTVTTNESATQYNVSVIASVGNEFLTVPLVFVNDITLPATSLAYPFSSVSFTGQDHLGANLDAPVIDLALRQVTYSYEPPTLPGVASTVVLSNVTSFDASNLARMGQVSGITTDAFGVQDLDIGSATLTLAKYGTVDYIYKCDTFDTLSHSCTGTWSPTSIVFTENSTHVSFEVDSFSGYGGGASNNTYLFSCGTLDSSTSDYVLANDVSSVGSCYTIAADNVNLDCANHAIDSTGSSAVYVDNFDGFSMKNCTVSNTNSTTAAVRLEDTAGADIANVTLMGPSALSLESVTSSSIKDSLLNGSASSITVDTASAITFDTLTLGGAEGLVANDLDSSSLHDIVFANLSKPLVVTSTSSAITMTNTTFVDRHTRLKYKDTLNVPAPEEVNNQNLKMKRNVVFVDSEAVGFLNTSAEITFFDVEYIQPRIGVSYNNTGFYQNCTVPQCTILSNDAAQKTLVFNVSHFTTYSSAGSSGGFSTFTFPGNSPKPVTLSCGESKVTNNNLFDLVIGALQFFFPGCEGGVVASDEGGYLKVVAGGTDGTHQCKVTGTDGSTPTTVNVPVTVSGCKKNSGLLGASGSGITRRQRLGLEPIGTKLSVQNPLNPVQIFQFPTAITQNPIPFTLIPGTFLVPTPFNPIFPTIVPPWYPSTPTQVPPSTPTQDVPEIDIPIEDIPFGSSTVDTPDTPTPPDFKPPFGRTITRPPRDSSTDEEVGLTPRPKQDIRPKCGDDKRNQPGEECDGKDNPCAAGQSCGPPGSAAPCKCFALPKCGDGKIDFGEDCEKSADCAAAFGPGYWCVLAGAANQCKCVTVGSGCGDGVFTPGTEECEADANCWANEDYGPGSKCSPPGATKACKCYLPGAGGQPTDSRFAPPEDEAPSLESFIPYRPATPSTDAVAPGDLPTPRPSDTIFPDIIPPSLPPEILLSLEPSDQPGDASEPSDSTREGTPTSSTPTDITEAPPLSLPPAPTLIPGPPATPVVSVPTTPTTLSLPPPSLIGPVFGPPAMSVPPATISPSTSVACTYLHTESKVQSLSFTDAKVNAAQGIPQGYEVAAPGFRVSCSGETMDVSVSVPKTFTDLAAYRCRNGACAPINYEATGEELFCGGQSLHNRVLDVINPPKTFMYEPGLIGVAFTEVGNEYPRFDAPGYALLFPDLIEDSIEMSAANPTTMPNLPNPLLGFASVPITLEFNNLGFEALRAEIRAQYTPTELYEMGSYQLYMLVGDKYIALDSEIDFKTQTVAATVPHIEDIINEDKLTLVVLATVCDACQDPIFEKVYDGGSSDAVILVHGFASSSLTWAPLIEEFKLTRQPQQLWVYSYPSNKAVNEIAGDLITKIDTQASSFASISFVGHSLGGLVAQQALKDAQLQNKRFVGKTKKAIIVGAPNDGSPVAKIYKDIVTSLANIKTFTRPLPGRADLLRSLVFGENINQVPGIDYEVIAGSRTLPFAGGLFTGPNDGITSVRGAQHIGSQFITNKCQDYFELDLTHTELIDYPISRRVIQNRLAQGLSSDALGNNQYLQLRLDSCSADDVFLVLGKPIPAAAAPDLLGCNCGNGVCGVDESQYTCPSDCAIIEQPKSIGINWGQIMWLVMMILACVVIAVAILVHVSKHKEPKLSKVPPGPKVPNASPVPSMNAKGAVVPKLAEVKPEPKPVVKKKPEPPRKPVNRELLRQLYKQPLRKKSNEFDLSLLDEEVKDEARRRLRKK